MRIQFDIKYRTQVESGECVPICMGHPVEILKWDRKSRDGYCILGVIRECEEEYVYLWNEKGEVSGNKDYNLYISIPEPELTGFEEAYLRIVHKLSPKDILPGFIEQHNLRRNCEELLGIAYREFLQGRYKSSAQCELQKVIASRYRSTIDGLSEEESMNMAHCDAECALSLAKAEVLRDMPKWRVFRKTNYCGKMFDPSWMIIVPYHGTTYEIWLQDLLDKLPKEE